MTLTGWITIGAAIVLGPLIGTIVSKIVSSIIGADHRPESLRKSAKPISSLFFWLCIVIALIVILSVFRPEVVDQLATDFVDFIPRVLVAGIILIGANVLSTFAVTALAPATARMPVDVQNKTNLVVKGIIVTFAALLAVSQVGIDTEVVNMVLAAVLFAIAASIVLIIGLGGFPVAKQIASARSLRRVIDAGDKISVDGMSGEVVEVGPTHISISNDEGLQKIPATTLMGNPYEITKN